MPKYRVLIGRIFHEANSFSPYKTVLTDFTIKRGPNIVDERVGMVLGGIIRSAKVRNAEVVPTLDAMTRPGGPVSQRVYEGFKEEILEIARTGRIDAVAFQLHGAMQTEELDDPEGDLLEAVRRVVGKGVPIAVGLDLHGHITGRMLANADFCTACKENPHSDFFETGERTLNRVLDILEGKIAPVTALGKVPMLTRGKDETTEGPIRALHDHARHLLEKYSALIDISIFNMTPHLDVPDLGQSVVVVADKDPDLASSVVIDLCERLWALRDEVVATYPTIAEAMALITANPQKRPFVLGDIGDRVLAGAPGDSPAILRYLLEHDLPLRAAIPIADPQAVKKAMSSGLGAKITLKVGGGFTPNFKPVEVTGVVTHLGSGDYSMAEGAFGTSPIMGLGRTAVLRVKNILLLLMTTNGDTTYPEAFTSQGIDIGDLDFLVVKSGYHFKMFFADIATPLCVDTPGLTVFHFEDLPFRRGRPFYPLDDIDYTPTTPSIFFGRGSKKGL